jgi:hypothetical protein
VTIQFECKHWHTDSSVIKGGTCCSTESLTFTCWRLCAENLPPHYDRSPTTYFVMQFKIFRSTVLNNLIYVLPHPIHIQCTHVCMCVHTHASVYMPNVSIRLSKHSVNYNDQHTSTFHYILYVNILLLRYFKYFIVCYHILTFYIWSLLLLYSA